MAWPKKIFISLFELLRITDFTAMILLAMLVYVLPFKYCGEFWDKAFSGTIWYESIMYFGITAVIAWSSLSVTFYLVSALEELQNFRRERQERNALEKEE
jgi:hypothetical protein